ncbi:TetR/AcrR family transcriptional regulator [Dactylosporangium sp. CA-233914]|uniref:TetR/AcrR family transcriptional regulator n=1 Tax=Dactylosporangium sp. CA-233914 TaxID=3239934 RepID=UPI003D934BA5
MKTRMTRAAREQQLLDVAEDLFLEAGYERTSIEDIARAAGVTRPVVYEHHGSKEGVYLACVRRARAHWNREILAAASASTDPREQLALGADAYYRVVERDPARWQLLIGAGGLVAGPLAGDLHRERLRTVNLIADLVEPHLPDADPQRVDAFANVASGGAEQLGRWWLAHPEVPRSKVVAYYVDTVWPAFTAIRAD